jgi:hypothetical protein
MNQYEKWVFIPLNPNKKDPLSGYKVRRPTRIIELALPTTITGYFDQELVEILVGWV